MIIIQKSFAHSNAVNEALEMLPKKHSIEDFANEMRNRESQDWSKTNLTDPAKRNEMIDNDRVHDTLEGLEKNNWDVMSLLKNDEERGKDNSNIALKPGQKDPRVLDLKPQGIAKARTRVRVPKTIENPVPEPKVEEFNAQADIQGETPEEIKAGMSGAAKAGLIGAGIAAVGAGSYAAYKAWKKRKAKKAAVDAEVNEFLERKYKTKK